MLEFIYVFDCPWHGLEHQVLCYRHDNIMDNMERWKKLRVIEVPMEVEDEERIKKFLEEKP